MRRWVVIASLAIVLCAVFLHAMGARTYTGFLSGTPVADDELLAGMAYILSWFGAILVAPIVVGAVFLDAACGTIAKRLRAWRASGRR